MCLLRFGKLWCSPNSLVRRHMVLVSRKFLALPQPMKTDTSYKSWHNLSKQIKCNLSKINTFIIPLTLLPFHFFTFHFLPAFHKFILPFRGRNQQGTFLERWLYKVSDARHAPHPRTLWRGVRLVGNSRLLILVVSSRFQILPGSCLLARPSYQF